LSSASFEEALIVGAEIDNLSLRLSSKTIYPISGSTRERSPLAKLLYFGAQDAELWVMERELYQT